jgi:hypothetical protein
MPTRELGGAEQNPEQKPEPPAVRARRSPKPETMGAVRRRHANVCGSRNLHARTLAAAVPTTPQRRSPPILQKRPCRNASLRHPPRCDPSARTMAAALSRWRCRFVSIAGSAVRCGYPSRNWGNGPTWSAGSRVTTAGLSNRNLQRHGFEATAPCCSAAPLESAYHATPGICTQSGFLRLAGPCRVRVKAASADPDSTEIPDRSGCRTVRGLASAGDIAAVQGPNVPP